LRNPDIEIGSSGTAHLAYAQEYYPDKRSLLYKYSYAPYSSWSAEPVRLDDVPYGGVTKPQLAVGASGRASVLHATWSDGPVVLYTRKVAQRGYAWSDPLKVGNKLYGSNGLAAAGSKAFSVFGRKTGVFGNRISSGVTCP
jgi:hypothetical protein